MSKLAQVVVFSISVLVAGLLLWHQPFGENFSNGLVIPILIVGCLAEMLRMSVADALRRHRIGRQQARKYRNNQRRRNRRMGVVR